MCPQFNQPFRCLSDEQRVRHLDEVRASIDASEPLWIFGYGSLLWRPCYEVSATRVVTLSGFRRSLCIWTIEARGSADSPGLGLGLMREASAACVGHAHRIEPAHHGEALAALWEREMLTGIYLPAWVSLAVDGQAVHALTFVVDPTHPQFAGDLDETTQAKFIASAVGALGTNAEYVSATVAALKDAGISDPSLEAVDNAVRARLSGRA